jgi:hypothetical protein
VGVRGRKTYLPKIASQIHNKRGEFKMRGFKLAPAWGFCVLLLLPSVPTGLFGQNGELLTFKPHPDSLEYRLTVNTHSEFETNSRSFGTERGVFEDHEDMLTISQSVTEIDDGLLDIALTFDEINLIEHNPNVIGAQPLREDIRGHTQHIVTTLLGEVREATGVPHFGSRNFYFRDDYGHLDNVPLDMYRVILAVYPQFPLRLLNEGDTWNVRDSISVTSEDLATEGVVATTLCSPSEHFGQNPLKN